MIWNSANIQYLVNSGFCKSFHFKKRARKTCENVTMCVIKKEVIILRNKLLPIRHLLHGSVPYKTIY